MAASPVPPSDTEGALARSEGAATPLAGFADRSNLTQSQLLLWMGQKLHPGVPLYNMALTFTIEGPLDPALFRQAFQALVTRSDALRTVVVEVGGIPQQRVQTSVSYALDVLDFSTEPDPSAALQAWAAGRSTQLFDLAACLFDVALVRLADERFAWYLNQHHLITDGWSAVLAYRRLADLYALARAGRLQEAPAFPAFSDYAAYERTYRTAPLYRRASAYWQEKLATPLKPVRFYGYEGSAATTRTRRVTRDLGPDRSAKLRVLAASAEAHALTEHVALFNLFITLLFAYLHRVSGQTRLTIGTPSHNRPKAAFKETLGVFIEIFPFQVEVAEEETFLSLLKKVQRETSAFLRYAQPGTSRPEINRSYNVLLNYINVSFPEFAGAPVQSNWVHPGHGDEHHHLRLQVHDFDQAGRFVLHFDFHEDVFEEAAQTRATVHFLRLLDGLLADPHRCIDHVDLTQEAEKQRLLFEFGTAPVTYGTDASVVARFEAQAAATPEAIALRFEGSTCTFRELNERANRLAHYLRQRGIGPEDRVGLFLRRSPEAIIGLLGVLKAGGAYVPIEPSYPAARVAFLLRDAQVPLLLATAPLKPLLPPLPADVVCLDADGHTIAAAPSHNPDPAPAPEQPAYVLYTSGSTGQPKGVMVSHGGLANYVAWARAYYLQGERLDFPLFSPLSFDLTVTSVFVPLTAGSTIVIYREEEGADLSILQVLRDDLVDVIKLTPAHLSLVKDRIGTTTRLKKLILGGEDLKTELARSVVAARQERLALYNEYGPTETVVGCMIHRYDPDADPAPSVPIGRPAAGARLYVLNPSMQPTPVGVPGEIYIGGPGVARGYLNRPALTEARFVPDPFRPGERLYRTGDLGRWLSDGTMAYLGRMDQQVKIRGARIELGEIEAALASHPSVEACVVDVVRHQAPSADAEVHYCTACGLASTYPDVTFDEAGVCNLCRSYATYKREAQQYFKGMEALRALFARRPRTGPYDCLMLLSGGKDSTYALYQLVGMGLKVLAFTLDNGYISEQAKANIRRVVRALEVDHRFGSTPAMNAIFADSLERYSNVCNGCFKTIYTLGLKLAYEKGIPYVVTGLSRGQFFETRLTADLFTGKGLAVDQIDGAVLDARKAYHRTDDAVNRLLGAELFEDDAVFEAVQFVDFYRYCDASLEEMLAFLAAHAPWIRPADTGRSTNCLINEVGIFVHKAERGFHNYALPYSWDVRMGHKTRGEALAELNDEIDPDNVRRILSEIGYEVRPAGQAEDRLAAYYVSDRPVAVSDFRAHLGSTLPAFMVPSYFVRLGALPLTPNGKIDRAALPGVETQRPELASSFVAPRTPLEAALAKIWGAVLKLPSIGIYDNFFDLGGDSITALQIIARANEAGMQLNPGQFFRHQTIAALGAVAEEAPAAPSSEQGLVSGPVPLTPIQQWFFERHAPSLHHWNQTLLVEAPPDADPDILEEALRHLLRHHDALRMTYRLEGNAWHQVASTALPPLRLVHVDLSARSPDEQAAAIAAEEIALHECIRLTEGGLVSAALFDCGAMQPKRLLLAIHHLVVDGVSWQLLLEDLHTAYHQLRRGQTVALPSKTTSFKRWAEQLNAYARSTAVRDALDHWLRRPETPVSALPVDFDDPAPMTEAFADTVSTVLSEAETLSLLHEVPKTYRTRTNEVLLAALALVFTRRAEGRPLLVDVEGHGREELFDGLDVSRTVGWFTTIFPLAVPLAPGADPENALKSVKERLRAQPHGGLSYGLLRYAHPDASVRQALAALPQAEVLFNYLGRLDFLPSEATLFVPVRPLALSRSQDDVRTYALEINAFVLHGRLQLDWTYSRRRHRPETIRQIADEAMTTLRSLITHCLSPGAGGYTPADFPLAKLDDRKLSKLSRLLRN